MSSLKSVLVGSFFVMACIAFLGTTTIASTSTMADASIEVADEAPTQVVPGGKVKGKVKAKKGKKKSSGAAAEKVKTAPTGKAMPGKSIGGAGAGAGAGNAKSDDGNGGNCVCDPGCENGQRCKASKGGSVCTCVD
jgi:hypothetical protein